MGLVRIAVCPVGLASGAVLAAAAAAIRFFCACLAVIGLAP